MRQRWALPPLQLLPGATQQPQNAVVLVAAVPRLKLCKRSLCALPQFIVNVLVGMKDLR